MTFDKHIIEPILATTTMNYNEENDDESVNRIDWGQVAWAPFPCPCPALPVQPCSSSTSMTKGAMETNMQMYLGSYSIDKCCIKGLHRLWDTTIIDWHSSMQRKFLATVFFSA